MAELGIVTSVIGIVGFALDLSKKLYQFAATTSAAGDEVGYIAKNVTNFVDALELLAERLDEGGEPIYSNHTVKVVARLYDQSCDLFDKIEELIPEPKSGRDELNFVQKVTWNFKKGRVEFLAGQIECLKTTASLVATVLFAGKKIRSKRAPQKRKHKTKPNRTELNRVRQRVTIAVVEHQQASNKLPDLQEKAVADDTLFLQAEDSDSTRIKATVDSSTSITWSRANRALKSHQVLGVDVDVVERKQMVIQDNDDLLLYSVERFTTLEVQEESRPAPMKLQGGDSGRQTTNPSKVSPSDAPSRQPEEHLVDELLSDEEEVPLDRELPTASMKTAKYDPKSSDQLRPKVLEHGRNHVPRGTPRPPQASRQDRVKERPQSDNHDLLSSKASPGLAAAAAARAKPRLREQYAQDAQILLEQIDQAMKRVGN